MELFGISLRDWTTAVIIFVAVLAVLVVVRAIVTRRLARVARRTTTPVDDIAVDLLNRTHYIFLLILAVGAASLALVLPARADVALRTTVVIAALLQGALWGNGLVGFWVRHLAARKSADAGARMTMAVIGYGVRVLLWTFILLLILENFGVNVTALVAGLGITGVAVALAVQNILSDLFAALSIVLDRPFVVGDSISVGDVTGTVEHIGLKSTRIRSIGGELVIIGNGDLLRSRVRNYRDQRIRRVIFPLAIAWGTPVEKLERVPHLVRDVIAAQPKVQFDRSHFTGVTETALTFESAYVLTDPAYEVYLDVQQRITLELLRRLEAEGIELRHV